MTYPINPNHNVNFNLDALGNVFFPRELEYVMPEAYETVYAPMKAAELIPVYSQVDVGAHTITYTKYDRVGMAQPISNYATDFPSIEVGGVQYTSPLIDLGISYAMSIQDMQSSAMASKNIAMMKQETALAGIAQRQNQIAFTGLPAANVPGWLTNPDVPSANVAGADANARLWANKTAEQILTDMKEIVNYIMANTKAGERATHLLLPLSRYNLIKDTKYVDGTGQTILNYFAQVHPEITVEWANELTGAFAGGVSGMIAYNKNIRKFAQIVPAPVQVLQAQWHQAAYTIYMMFKYGGTIIFQPKSQAFRLGI